MILSKLLTGLCVRKKCVKSAIEGRQCIQMTDDHVRSIENIHRWKIEEERITLKHERDQDRLRAIARVVRDLGREIEIEDDLKVAHTVQGKFKLILS